MDGEARDHPPAAHQVPTEVTTRKRGISGDHLPLGHEAPAKLRTALITSFPRTHSPRDPSWSGWRGQECHGEHRLCHKTRNSRHTCQSPPPDDSSHVCGTFGRCLAFPRNGSSRRTERRRRQDWAACSGQLLQVPLTSGGSGVSSVATWAQRHMRRITICQVFLRSSRPAAWKWGHGLGYIPADRIFRLSLALLGPTCCSGRVTRLTCATI
jgi:hypothetical protein